MLNVASEATTHALNSRRLHAPSQPQPGRTPATSFASMLDDTQAATAQAQAETTDARSTRTDDKPAAKMPDGKTTKSDQSDNSKPSASAAPASAPTDKPTDQPNSLSEAIPLDQPVDSKAAAAIKVVKTALNQNGKPADSKETDSKPTDTATTTSTDAATPVETAPPPTIDPTQAVKTGAVVAAVTAPVIVATPISTPTLAPIADGGDDATPSPDEIAAGQGDAGKAADAALIGKAGTALQTGVKPQGSSAETDNSPVAHAHSDTTDQPKVSAPTLATDTGGAAPKTDITQPLPAPTQTVQTAAPTAAAPATAQQAPQAAAIPLSGVAVEIASKAGSGKNHFEIRLDPPELGRIEVRLSVDRDGNVSSRLIADRADTLDLLRRDASGLERALQDAGLKTSDNGLQFSLRDQSAYQQQQQQQQQQAPGTDVTQLVVQDTELPIDTPARNYGRLAGLGGGLDIQV